MGRHASITRRSALSAGAGALGAGLAATAAAQTPSPKKTARLNFEDPRERARIRAKVTASTVAETVYSFYKLHLYAWLGEGNLKPLVTMSNLNATVWKPLPNGNYSGRVHEVGIYNTFDTDELLTSWKNPVTGDTREVWDFIGGPLEVELGPDGAITGADATVKPVSQMMEIIGDHVFVPSQSAFSFPSPFDAQKWPKESAGPTFYWDSHFVHAAPVAAVADPAVARVTSFSQFQNFVSFHPWLGMGGREGRTYGKAYGAKLAGLDQVPAKARANLEKRTPEIFDLANWKQPRRDFVEYMQKRKPT